MRFGLVFILSFTSALVFAQTRSQSVDYTAFNVYWNGSAWTSYAAGYGNILGSHTGTGDFYFYTTGNATSAGLTRTLTQAAAITAAGTVSSTAVQAYTGSFGNINVTGSITQNNASVGGGCGRSYLQSNTNLHSRQCRLARVFIQL